MEKRITRTYAETKAYETFLRLIQRGWVHPDLPKNNRKTTRGRFRQVIQLANGKTKVIVHLGRRRLDEKR